MAPRRFVGQKGQRSPEGISNEPNTWRRNGNAHTREWDGPERVLVSVPVFVPVELGAKIGCRARHVLRSLGAGLSDEGEIRNRLLPKSLGLAPEWHPKCRSGSVGGWAGNRPGLPDTLLDYSDSFWYSAARVYGVGMPVTNCPLSCWNRAMATRVSSSRTPVTGPP